MAALPVQNWFSALFYQISAPCFKCFQWPHEPSQHIEIEKEREMSKEQIPYDEVDKNVRFLVEVLNRFPGLHTIGSCGGHTNPAPYQESEGQWYVVLQVDHTEEGWRSLEFLAWAIGDFKRAGRLLSLEASSPPPYLNTPGQCLSFVLHGKDFTPDDLAALINEWREEDYVAVAFLRRCFGSGGASNRKKAGHVKFWNTRTQATGIPGLKCRLQHIGKAGDTQDDGSP